VEDAFVPTGWTTHYSSFFWKHFIANLKLIGTVDAYQFHWRFHREPIILLHNNIGKVKCAQKKKAKPNFQTHIELVDLLLDQKLGIDKSPYP
jgi:hypothetical protein